MWPLVSPSRGKEQRRVCLWSVRVRPLKCLVVDLLRNDDSVKQVSRLGGTVKGGHKNILLAGVRVGM